MQETLLEESWISSLRTCEIRFGMQKKISGYDGRVGLVRQSLQRSSQFPYSHIHSWTVSEVASSLSKAFDRELVIRLLRLDTSKLKLEELGKTAQFLDMSGSHNVAILASILATFSSELKQFEELYHKFYANYLNKKFRECDDLLNECEARFGYSKWLISNRFLILQKWQGVGDQKKRLRLIQENDLVDPRIKFLTSYYSLRVEEEVPWSHFYDTYIEGRIERAYKRKVIDGAYRTFYLANVSQLMDADFDDLRKMLQIESNFSIYDLYFSFINFCQIVLMKKRGTKAYKDTKEILSQVISLFDSDSLISRLGHLWGITVFRLNSDSEKFIKSLDRYTLGDYEQCLGIDSCLKENSYIEQYELIAKSGIKSLNVPASDSIQSSMSAIVSQSINGKESFEVLRKEALNTMGSGISSAITSFLLRESGSDRKNNHHLQDVHSYICSGIFNPRLFLSVPEISKAKALDSIKSPTFNIFKALMNNKEDLLSDQLPAYRANKYKGIIKLNSKYFQEASLDFEDALRVARDCDRPSLLKNLSYCYIELGQYDKCADLIVRECLNNKALIQMLPLQELVERMPEENYTNSEKALNAAIAYDLCIKNYVASKEIEENRAFAYDDFVSSSQAGKPSEVKYEFGEINIQRHIYFLESICIPGVMDVSDSFKNPDELIEERKNVLLLLGEINPGNKHQYQAELKGLIFESLIQKKVASSHFGKIRINRPAVIAEIKRDVGEDFRRFKSLQVVRHYVTDSTLKYSTLFQPENEMNSIVEALASKSLDIFLFGINGIDVNLSVDIRHGTLENFLHRNLKEVQLMALFENGSPVLSEINFSNLDSHQKAILAGSLVALSRKMRILTNFLLKKSIRAKADPKKSGMLLVELDRLTTFQIKNTLLSEEDLEGAIAKIMDIYWAKTAKGLEAVRVYFSSQVKSSINRVFQEAIELLRDNVDLSSSNQVRDLINAHTRTTDDLALIEKWLQISKSQDSEDFHPKVAPEVARQLIQSYGKHVHSPEVVITHSGTQELIQGAFLKPLVKLFEIAFLNAIAHSLIGPKDLKISVELSLSNGELVVFVRSDLSDRVDVKKLKKTIQEKKVAIKKMNSSSVRMEGGSGILKAANIVKHEFRRNGSMNIYIDKGQFVFEFMVGGV